jgi:hypothetical protein
MMDETRSIGQGERCIVLQAREEHQSASCSTSRQPAFLNGKLEGNLGDALHSGSPLKVPFGKGEASIDPGAQSDSGAVVNTFEHDLPVKETGDSADAAESGVGEVGVESVEQPVNFCQPAERLRCMDLTPECSCETTPD